VIRIHVGSDPNTKPFFVPQSILESTSGFFVKALQYEHFGIDSQPGVLRFSEDDLATWKVLL